MRIYSVTEFRSELNDLLHQVNLAIEGEVSSFNISQGRFVWFTIKDEKTSVDCFMMAFHLKVKVEEGMMVRVVGSPTLFTKGKFVFRPKRVEVVGEGSLQRQFELLKGQLEKEGLFDESRKRELPRFPTRIGLVTSSDAAAYTDVLRILENRWGGLEIVHRHVQVQGASAVGSIVAGLEQLNDEEPDLDALILTRGGGSMEDLQAFNSEEVARAIYASRIPVVSAVGHERDTTIADLVSDVRASTPSNAAELVVPDRRDILNELEYVFGRLSSSMQAVVGDYVERVDSAVTVLESRARAQVDQFVGLEQRLQLAFSSFRRDVQERQERVHGLEKLLQSFNPHNVLKRGYTMTMDEKGKAVTSIRGLKKGAVLSTHFADGVAKSTVTDLEK